MNLIILDKNFQPIAPINTLQSLIWNRRYRDPGTFELHAGAADFSAIKEGKYIYRDDREELGVIYERDIKRNKSGAKTCYAKGYFAEYLLNDRVITRTQRLSGTPEDIARELVDLHFINTQGQDDYDGRSLDGHLVLGPLSGARQDSMKYQGTGSAVGTALYDLEADQALSHKVVYDYETDTLIFSVYKGEDRGAIFSDKYGNLKDTNYHSDTTDAPNVVYIAGNGEGVNRKVMRLDLRESKDEDAREMYVDARDLQQHFIGDDGESYSYTDEDYEELLLDRGRQRAAEHSALERFEVSADATANLVYLKDYDLGDFCAVDVDGVRLDKQITGVRETYEDGKVTIELTIGDYGPTSVIQSVTKQAQINQSTPPTTQETEDLTQLLTDAKEGFVPAINEIFMDFEDLGLDVGDLDLLETEAKESLVDAVNELLLDLGDIDIDVGDLSKLNTQAKGSLVDALNEVLESGGGGGTGGGGDLPTSYYKYMPVAFYLSTIGANLDFTATVRMSDLGLSRNFYAYYMGSDDKGPAHNYGGTVNFAIEGMRLSLYSSQPAGQYAGAWGNAKTDIGFSASAGYGDYDVTAGTVETQRKIARGASTAGPLGNLALTNIPQNVWAPIMARIRYEEFAVQAAEFSLPFVLSNPVYLGEGTLSIATKAAGYLWAYRLAPAYKSEVESAFMGKVGAFDAWCRDSDGVVRPIANISFASSRPVPPFLTNSGGTTREIAPVFHFAPNANNEGWVARLCGFCILTAERRLNSNASTKNWSSEGFERWIGTPYLSSYPGS